MEEAVAGPSQSPRHPVNIPNLDLIDVYRFDWKAFESTYKDRALITRLLHIPELILSPTVSPTPNALALAHAALLRLLPHIRALTWDHGLYLRAVSLLDSVLHPGKVGGEGESMDGMRGREETGVPDMEWVEEAMENQSRESSRLDVELRGYLSNLIKESIRLTYLAFAQLGHKVGNSNSAMNGYSGAREYSSSPQHHVELGLGILKTCLSYNLPTSLPGHISKLEAALDRVYPPPVTGSNRQNAAENANLTANEVRETREREAKSESVRKAVGVQIRVGKGLVALAAEEYEKAGRELGQIFEEGGLAESEGQAISTADTALISALCVLATGKRDTIRHVLFHRTTFRSSLDDSQGWLLDLVLAFVDARYGEAASLLKTAEPMLLLNPYLSPHVHTLIELIQKRSVIQYVTPFSSVRLEDMARAFGMADEEMLLQVEALVEKKEIHGKIDLVDLILEMRSPDVRAELYANALKMGKKSSNETRAALFRMRLHEAGIVVDPRPSENRDVGMGPTDSLELDETTDMGPIGTR